jgi:hypothetical protein
MKRVFVLGSAVAVLAAMLCCGTALAQDEEYALKDYMPQTVGSTWTMKSTGGRGEGTVTVEVQEPQDVNGVEVPVIVTKSEDGTIRSGSLETVDDDNWTIYGSIGVRGRRGGGEAGAQPAEPTTTIYDTPIKYPGKLKVGQTAEASLNMTMGERQVEVTLKLELAAIETVTVPNGTLEGCLKLVTTRGFGERQFSETTWYAKGIGAVKTERPGRGEGAARVTELIDYELAE